MYLWRFAIEQTLPVFLKQKLGLTTANSPALDQRQRWVWCCALAYCQLLLMRQEVADKRPPWQPPKAGRTAHPLTRRTGAAPGAHLFAGVGHTGSAYPTRRKRPWTALRVRSQATQAPSGGHKVEKAVEIPLILLVILQFKLLTCETVVSRLIPFTLQPIWRL